MAAADSSAGIGGRSSCREDVLPAPLKVRVRVFALESKGQVDSAKALPDCLIVKLAHFFQMGAEVRYQRGRDDRDAILVALTIADDDAAVGKLEIFHSKAQGLGETQTATVEERTDQPVGSL